MWPSWPQRCARPDASSDGRRSRPPRSAARRVRRGSARSGRTRRHRRRTRRRDRRDPSRSGPAASARESGRPRGRSPPPRRRVPARGAAPVASPQLRENLRRSGPWETFSITRLPGDAAAACRKGRTQNEKWEFPLAAHRFTTQSAPPAQRRPEGRQDRPPRPNLPLTPWNRSMLESRIGQSEA